MHVILFNVYAKDILSCSNEYENVFFLPYKDIKLFKYR